MIKEIYFYISLFKYPLMKKRANIFYRLNTTDVKE